MTQILERLRATGPVTRVAALVTAIAAIGVAGSAVGDGAGDLSPYRSPERLERLLAESRAAGRIVVDRRGRPVLGPDGKPLRVARDGRALLDSRGRPLRNRNGRPLRIGSGGRLPAGATRGPGRPGRPKGRDGRGRRGDRRTRRPGGRRPGSPRPGPSGGAGPVVIAAYYPHPRDVDTIASIVGVRQDSGNPDDQLRAIEAYLDATGGIEGRKVKLVGHKGVPSGDALCNAVAKDEPVAAIGTPARPSKNLACLARRDVPVFDLWVSANPEYLEKYPSHYWVPHGADVRRLARAYVRGLVAAGFFERRARVGLLTYDAPGMDRARAALLEALRDAGIPIAKDKAVSLGLTSEAEAANFVTAATSAAVEFQAAGIDHVVGLDVAGAVIMPFMRAAIRQRYAPRYGLNTGHAPETLRLQGTLHTELARSTGVGWSPLFDVPENREPASRTRELCEEIFRAQSVDVGDRTWYGQYQALGLCDMVLLIREALRRSDRISTEGLRTGLESLRTAWDSSLTLATRLAPDQHDGAAEFRVLRYQTSCRCFEYSGPPVRE